MVARPRYRGRHRPSFGRELASGETNLGRRLDAHHLTLMDLYEDGSVFDASYRPLHLSENGRLVVVGPASGGVRCTCLLAHGATLLQECYRSVKWLPTALAPFVGISMNVNFAALRG